MQIKENTKLRVTGLCVGNSPVTGEFPAQRASNAEMFPFDDTSLPILIMLHQFICKTGGSCYIGCPLLAHPSTKRQNGHHFVDDIFKYFMNETFYISIQISLKCVPKVPIDNYM